MNHIEVKTVDLIGPALDWAVASALGWVTYPTDSVEQGRIFHTDPARAPFGPYTDVSDFKPSTNWAQGGPLIPQYQIETAYFGEQVRACVQVVTDHGTYKSAVYEPFYGDPADTLVVAMRAVVQRVLGSTVRIPAELLGVSV